MSGPIFAFVQDDPDFTDPVERLRKALTIFPELLLRQDPALARRYETASTSGGGAELLEEARQKLVAQQVQELRSIPQMLDGLNLREWPDNQEETTKAIEKIRTRLGDRYVAEVRRLLKEGTFTKRLALLRMLAETTTKTRWPENQRGMGPGISPDLIRLINSETDPQIRVAAALTLGEIDPDPGPAVATLGELANSKQVAERRAASRALASMIRVAAEFGRYDKARSWQSGTEMGWKNQIDTAKKVLPIVSTRLNDSDAKVRQACAQALLQVAQAAAMPRSPERFQDEQAALKNIRTAYQDSIPLVKDLSCSVPRLADNLRGSDFQARLDAFAALEAIADARLSRKELVAKGMVAAKPDDDSLAQPLRAIAPALAKELIDKEVRIRLASLYVLESMHGEAAPAADAVVQALKDEDPFVRWGAARTIGNLAPLAADKAVPALGAVLTDPNGDVRLGALLALRNYGPAARDASMPLGIVANQSGTELALLALQVLGAIGKEARPAAGHALKALSAAEPRVRAAAATALGKIGTPAPATVEALLKAMSDPDPEVRTAASAALLEP